MRYMIVGPIICWNCGRLTGHAGPCIHCGVDVKEVTPPSFNCTRCGLTHLRTEVGYIHHHCEACSRVYSRERYRRQVGGVTRPYRKEV